LVCRLLAQLLESLFCHQFIYQAIHVKWLLLLENVSVHIDTGKLLTGLLLQEVRQLLAQELFRREALLFLERVLAHDSLLKKFHCTCLSFGQKSYFALLQVTLILVNLFSKTFVIFGFLAVILPIVYEKLNL